MEDMIWLTDKSRIEQTNEANNWYLLDNEVFEDEDGSIYLTPRGFKTDNYTIPDWVAFVAGNKAKWDVRPSHLHDFACEYHKLIRITMTKSSLRRYKYLKVNKDGIFICEDIPTNLLQLVDVTKWEADCMFKRAMKATRVIPARVYNTFRCGVFFNFGWLKKPKKFDFNNIYKRENNEPPKY